MITIELPWPDKALNPNARNRWAKIKATKEARSIGYCEAYMKGYHRQYEGAVCQLQLSRTFHPPDRRRRDEDNHVSMLKGYQDGIFECLWIDDSSIKRTITEWGEVVKGGKVVLTLEEMPDAPS